jgi:probable phosphoglycerate mutase
MGYVLLLANSERLDMKEARQHRFTPPKGAADLLLIRHGETQAAVRGESFPMVEGQGDPALRPEGEAQAHAVGLRLKTEPIKAIYVTTMQRTHQTAAPLAQHLGLVPRVERDLREVFLGDWDGGEFTAQLQARVRAGLLRIAAAHAGELVAVVVHGGVVSAALAIATGSPAFAFNGADNGSISRLVVHGEQMIMRGFNDVSHL